MARDELSRHLADTFGLGIGAQPTAVAFAAKLLEWQEAAPYIGLAVDLVRRFSSPQPTTAPSWSRPSG